MADPAIPPDPEVDRRFMGAALRLGRRNLGRTFPNPAVGAVIVRNDGEGWRVVGHGWTAAGGQPHAETQALAEAGPAARGATAYVSLEPCAHHGKTPPCAEALVAAGVSRVVTTMADPDARVSGRGHALLESAGITVTTGVLAAEARLTHAGHISRVTRGRPWVTLKLAVSADGMIGRREGERMIITGRGAFDLVQSLRSESDAVMVGIGTVEVDDPRLTVRQSGVETATPIRVILDTNARLDPNARLTGTAREVPVWLMVQREAPAERIAALEEAGVVVLRQGEGSGGVDMNAVMTTLGERGITRLLVEGGSRVAATLISMGLADEVILFRAPVVVGPEGVRALAGHAMSAIERSPRYQLVDDALIGEDRLRRYLRVN